MKYEASDYCKFAKCLLNIELDKSEKEKSEEENVKSEKIKRKRRDNDEEENLQSKRRKYFAKNIIMQYY